MPFLEKGIDAAKRSGADSKIQRILTAEGWGSGFPNKIACESESQELSFRIR